ncbi:MAG TPA: hypothetical protein VK400_01830 [Pyrinomonadaceae bacterium]|nr:hypothetical protein [Pyrinomonadaceae bacterium]
MRIFTRIFLMQLIALVAACGIIFGQNEYTFASGDGGFKINLPKTVSSSRDINFNHGNISGYGKVYTWENPEYYYRVLYYKVEAENKVLTAPQKNSVINPVRETILKEAKEKKLPVTEKPYPFDGSSGTEIQIFYPNGKGIMRYFFAGKRFYLIAMSIRLGDSEARVRRILDSFSLLDTATLVAVKLAEAEPSPLPQTPAAAKFKSDALDNNLRSRVESVVEDIQYAGKAKRERHSERYYNEQGNLVREVDYLDGYPSDITVWGYIDGNRVSDVNFIFFDDDQLPPSERSTGVIRIGSPDEANLLPRDWRYSTKYDYKYNENGQLTELLKYQNNGRLSSRTVYNYKENQREEITFDGGGAETSRTLEILDKDGNVIEQNFMTAAGKFEDKTVYAYEFDSKGNWIVQEALKAKKIKGKTVMRPVWTAWRTIKYYAPEILPDNRALRTGKRASNVSR